MLAVAVTDEQPIPIDPVSSESKGWAAAAHILPLLGLPLVGPLIIWVIKHEDDPFVEEHAREALNFWISVFMYAFMSSISPGLIGVSVDFGAMTPPGTPMFPRR